MRHCTSWAQCSGAISKSCRRSYSKEMKWLGPILLVGVFLRHDTAQWLPGYNPGAWFYILGGAWEVILCSALLLTFHAIPLLTAALWIGVFEGRQVSVCRLATHGSL